MWCLEKLLEGKGFSVEKCKPDILVRSQKGEIALFML